MSVVTKGLQHETDRQKESEQVLNLNPIQQMLIGPGIGNIKQMYFKQVVCILITLNLFRSRI